MSIIVVYFFYFSTYLRFTYQIIKYKNHDLDKYYYRSKFYKVINIYEKKKKRKSDKN